MMLKEACLDDLFNGLLMFFGMILKVESRLVLEMGLRSSDSRPHAVRRALGSIVPRRARGRVA